MSLIAKRYAEAFLDLSEDAGTIDAYRNELTAVSDIYESGNGLRDFLLSPKTKTSDKKQLLNDLFEGRAGKNTLCLLQLLLDKTRIKYLPEISREYAKMADERKNFLSITIKTAFALDKSQIDGICTKFRELFHAASVKAAVEIDPSLIGGVQVYVGDKLYDGTLKGKLSRLQKVLGV